MLYEQLRDYISLVLYNAPRTEPEAHDYWLPRDLAHALIREGWVTSMPKLRFELRVIPLDQRNGGKYEVVDNQLGDTVSIFTKVWDAVAYVNHLNGNGRESEKVQGTKGLPTGSSGVAGEL
jgi:hypothetical protein